jgi:hypothetical protein
MTKTEFKELLRDCFEKLDDDFTVYDLFELIREGGAVIKHHNKAIRAFLKENAVLPTIKYGKSYSKINRADNVMPAADIPEKPKVQQLEIVAAMTVQEAIGYLKGLGYRIYKTMEVEI